MTDGYIIGAIVIVIIIVIIIIVVIIVVIIIVVIIVVIVVVVIIIMIMIASSEIVRYRRRSCAVRLSEGCITSENQEHQTEEKCLEGIQEAGGEYISATNKCCTRIRKEIHLV
jgi:ABC-type bacteriocin/lantibiotic exporter with double-glycine peptidase domain